jgi:hypothetical protein
MELQNVEMTPERTLRPETGACGECGGEGPLHDFHGDLVCAQCRAREEAALERPRSRGLEAPPL